MKRLITLLFILLFTIPSLMAQSSDVEAIIGQTLSTMSLEEKVGQLFMVAAYSNKDEAHQKAIEALVTEHHIGGVIVMQGGPVRQQRLIQRLQSASTVPLLVGQDAEWGQAMRLDSTYKFPTALTVGAAGSKDLAQALGAAMAYECQRVGVHMSFSPVLDVNTNPNNPIIGVRSFGSDAPAVTQMGLATLEGFADGGVLNCGKHFPGHGDTQQDSHKTLPKVERSLEELKAIEWVPFQAAVSGGADAMMIAHLNIPALEPSGKPTSLSRTVIRDILRKEWGFDGLVLTDALNMKGVSEFAPAGQLEVEAFLAGNDILLFPTDVPKAAATLVAAFQNGTLQMTDLDQSVRRILRAKYSSQAQQHWEWAQQGVMVDSLQSQFPSLDNDHEALTWDLIKKSATLSPHGAPAFPVAQLAQQFCHISIGAHATGQTFSRYLDKYAEMPHLQGAIREADLKNSDAFVVSFHQDPKNPWRRYKLTTGEQALMREVLGTGKPVYYVQLANPYGVLTLPEQPANLRVLHMFENNEAAQKLAPQFLFGARPVVGKLPVELGIWGTQGSGKSTRAWNRLSYGFPEEAGIHGDRLTAIDSIMHHAIANEATPGGQILIARGGEVIYDKSFGHHTYEKKSPVRWSDLYDIASITKITGTLPGLMTWYEKQPLLLESTLGNHTRRLDGSDKEHLVIEDVLAHQSGLDAWIPYYVRTIATDSTKNYWYAPAGTPNFVSVSNTMAIRPEIRDTMFAMLAESALKSKDYRYSDLGYYLFMEMLEERFNEPIDRWVKHTFYEPIGAKRLTYNPLDAGFSLEEIVPTEEDVYWRNERVHGRVHDMGAAMLGGVAGHAGLFANANDLAKMMQLYLNGGSYGPDRFFEAGTLEKFTSCAFCELKNRRGLGFDKRQLEDGPGPSCTCASSQSFGHTGFTGTMVWMDPAEDLLYVFLSNRTYPDMENWKLSRLDVRTNIQSVIYDAIH